MFSTPGCVWESSTLQKQKKCNTQNCEKAFPHQLRPYMFFTAGFVKSIQTGLIGYEISSFLNRNTGSFPLSISYQPQECTQISFSNGLKCQNYSELPQSCDAFQRAGGGQGKEWCSSSHRQVTPTLSSVQSTTAWQAAQWQKNLVRPTQAAQVPRSPYCSYTDVTSGLKSCFVTAVCTVNLLSLHCTPLNKVHVFTRKTYLENKALEIASEQFSSYCNLWSMLPRSLSRTGW